VCECGSGAQLGNCRPGVCFFEGTPKATTLTHKEMAAIVAALTAPDVDLGEGAKDAAKLAGSIVGLIQGWITANKQIPSEIESLKVLAATINSSCAHLVIATEGLRDLLEAIASSLRTAKDILEEYGQKKQSKWFFNPKKCAFVSFLPSSLPPAAHIRVYTH